MSQLSIREPIPHARAYDLYWKFAFARQAIFYARIDRREKPWTDDPILTRYKFCNVYRASDRVSQYLIHDVAYGETSGTPEERLFQITAFRLFSKIETWESLKVILGGPPTLADLRDGSFGRALQRTRDSQGVIYTAAFILCATDAYDRKTKHENHVELLKHMFLKESAGSKLGEAKSLAEVYAILRDFPLIGDFMAYQLAIDLNYSALLDHDENDFTQPGPGAMRGIRKAFCDLGDFSPQEVIQHMVQSQEAEFSRLDLKFEGLWGRPLHAIDCQGLFCELDKYCRQALPDLPSNRTRIKAKFTPSERELKLFYPPKWGINDLLPEKVRREPRFPVPSVSSVVGV